MHRFYSAVVLTVLSVTSINAQTAHIVTEDEFLSVVDGSHPALVDSSQALAHANARAKAASVFDNPELELKREDPSGPESELELAVSWQLPGLDRASTIAARRATADEAGALLELDLVLLRRSLRAIYAEWALSAAREQIFEGQGERIAGLVRREASRLEAGESSGLRLRRLELDAAEWRARAVLARSESERARAKAAVYDPGISSSSQPMLPSLPTAPEASADHPALRAARAELAAASFESEAARQVFSSPEVVLGWKRQKAGPISRDGPIIGFEWTVPLFDRKQAERSHAEARVRGARARLETANRELETLRATALSSYLLILEAVEHSQLAQPDNEGLLAAVEAGFRSGELSLTDLLDSFRAVAESQLSALDLHEAALTIFHELESLTPSADQTIDWRPSND